jgi:hypothetical protein
MEAMTKEIAADTAYFGRPDWVMCGWPSRGGVTLLASKEMTHAELEAQYGWEETGMRPDSSPPLLRGRRITLTSGLKTFIVIEAPDYATAFKALFEQWTPGPGEHAALPGIPAIEAAT